MLRKDLVLEYRCKRAERFLRPVMGFLCFGGLSAAVFFAWFYLFASHDYLLPLAPMLIAASLEYVFTLTDKVRIEQYEKQQANSLNKLHPRFFAPL